jgi:hypothetical protein
VELAAVEPAVFSLRTSDRSDDAGWPSNELGLWRLVFCPPAKTAQVVSSSSHLTRLAAVSLPLHASPGDVHAALRAARCLLHPEPGEVAADMDKQDGFLLPHLVNQAVTDSISQIDAGLSCEEDGQIPPGGLRNDALQLAKDRSSPKHPPGAFLAGLLVTDIPMERATPRRMRSMRGTNTWAHSSYRPSS